MSPIASCCSLLILEFLKMALHRAIVHVIEAIVHVIEVPSIAVCAAVPCCGDVCGPMAELCFLPCMSCIPCMSFCYLC